MVTCKICNKPIFPVMWKDRIIFYWTKDDRNGSNTNPVKSDGHVHIPEEKQIDCNEEKQIGCKNPLADKVRRINNTWSDTNLDRQMFGETFSRLQCKCGGTVFEVLYTADYETSARCVGCGMYYIVHCG